MKQTSGEVPSYLGSPSQHSNLYYHLSGLGTFIGPELSARHAREGVGYEVRVQTARCKSTRHSGPLQKACQLNNKVMVIPTEPWELHRPAACPVPRPGESGAKHRNTPNLVPDILRYIPVRRPSLYSAPRKLRLTQYNPRATHTYYHPQPPPRRFP